MTGLCRLSVNPAWRDRSALRPFIEQARWVESGAEIRGLPVHESHTYYQVASFIVYSEFYIAEFWRNDYIDSNIIIGERIQNCDVPAIRKAVWAVGRGFESFRTHVFFALCKILFFYLQPVIYETIPDCSAFYVHIAVYSI